MRKERSVVLGMMSEICIKGRIILNSLKSEESLQKCQDIASKIDRLEAEMSSCSEEFDCLMPK